MRAGRNWVFDLTPGQYDTRLTLRVKLFPGVDCVIHVAGVGLEPTNLIIMSGQYPDATGLLVIKGDASPPVFQSRDIPAAWVNPKHSVIFGERNIMKKLG